MKAHLLCDRDNPTQEFRDAFKQTVQERGSKCVQLYAMEGRPSDLPFCFVDRLYHYELQDLYAGLFHLRNPQLRIVPLRWHREENPHRERWLGNLQYRLLQKLGGEESRSQDALVAKIQKQLAHYDVVFVRHVLLEEDWHDGMRPLLRDYLDFLCQLAGGRAHIVVCFVLERAKSDPTLLCRLRRLLGWRRMDLAKLGKMLSEVESEGIRYHCLNRLGEIRKSHIDEMIEETDRRLLVENIDEEIECLFRNRRTICMEQVLNLFKVKDLRCGELGVEHAG